MLPWKRSRVMLSWIAKRSSLVERSPSVNNVREPQCGATGPTTSSVRSLAARRVAAGSVGVISVWATTAVEVACSSYDELVAVLTPLDRRFNELRVIESLAERRR
jgi:hypothetical protein